MVKAQSKEYSAFGGAVFLCSHLTRKESFNKKIFGLSPHCADFVEKVKAGTTLFLYDVEQCKLHGVFEATSNGAVNIIPDAYVSSGRRYPSQIRFKRIWFCKPLMEGEFRDAVQNYSIKNKFSYGLSHQQVAKLLHLFSSRNRLQLCQNPRLKDDLPRELETSLVKVTDVQSSPTSSSCGSFRSPCQTCSSSTLGDKLTDSASLVHRGLQSDISDVAKSKCSQPPLHTGADTAMVTIPSNQEAMHEKSTDDFIPLPQEEDTLEGVDDLFGLLKDESPSSESKGSSDSEDHTTFHHVCVRKEKEDECYPPMLNSKLRSDSEGRTSVFSRLVKTHKTYIQGKRSKTEASPPRGAQSFNPLSQRKKMQKAQHSKPFPCHNDRMLFMPSSDRLNRLPASNHSFVWRRSTKYSGGKQNEIQTFLEPLLCEDGNKWDVSGKQPVRYNSCKTSFVPKGCSKLTDSCDNELNMPAVFPGEHDSSEVNVKEEMRTSSMNVKQRANESRVEGGDQDFYSEDVEGTRRKKRQATAFFPQECPSDIALVPKGTKTSDMLGISDENLKEKGIILSCKDAHTQLARPYFETNVLLQDEQQQSFQGSFEYDEEITSDSSLILESSTIMDTLGKHGFGDKKTSLKDEMQSHVADGHLGTEISLQQNETQSIRSCHRVVNGDKILLMGKFETMDILPKHDEDCENKKSLPSDGSGRLVTSCNLETEMPLLQKQTANIQSCSEVVHDYEVLVPEISKVMFPKFDADSGNKGTSMGSGYPEEVCHLVKSYQETVPSDAAPVLEGCGPLINSPAFHGDSAEKIILLDETSEHLSTDQQGTVMLSQVKHYRSCCGDTSSVLEYSTVGTSAEDGDSEHKNSFDQKDDESLYLVTDSKDHRNTANTSSSGGSRSCAPTDDQECSKPMLLKEEQYQNFQGNSNSLDSFAVLSEGCGSKSGISVDRTSGHLVADLLGTSSESRTSFVNDSSNGPAGTFSTSAFAVENADHTTNGSEAYAEPPILQHDPGEAMEQL
ncbi:hypothetical protein GQ55_4G321400 [Panicum hallii var. hallii]|uniref:DCD domain-containing protein n=1 Tax=Panicum hallii var. hallii TaxID=1504633 RepID=A0A2T7E2A3_9POAL|nr:hypothetical protein GQ55_4G321400 [Panicum hallii var. hallii]PUZ61976.1 hypothetical protein GQ55_4G321400 [Panicum hallii var. hallii]